uniref:Putative myosin-i-binding protein n=1 Tax=Corethrella appendiculata TaxID=1370023 RepID=W4VRD5_9DIPT
MSTRSQLTKDLNESVKHVLGRHTKILVKYMIKLETKGDKTENRVLVFTPVRIYLLTAKVPTRIDCHFHYLDIQSIESKKPTHFSITTSDKTYSFCTIGDAGNFSSNADVILIDLSSAIKQIFPTVPLKYIIRKIEILPPERQSILTDELRPSDRPCGGFSLQYACMCDFHGVPYREEVAWDIDTIYLSHDNRVLNLRDFDHLEPKDLMAIVSALEYNTFFRGLKITHARLSTETMERILHVLRRSMWLEELHLEGLGLKPEFVHKLAVSVISNNNPALISIDLSHNFIEDKGAVHLAGPIAKISKGLCKLSLSHSGLTAKGVNNIAHSLSLNQSVANSLVYLDISGNNLKDDISNLYNFLAQPNVLEYLDISKTDTTLENLFGALLRGCTSHLAHLNVSHNSFGTKKGKEIPPSFKHFFTSSLTLKRLNIASCKLPLEALKHLLLGLACNESTSGIYLDISGNQLGIQGAHVLETCIHGVKVLQTLDISDNNMDYELASVITAIGKNPSIRSLHMVKSFSGMKLKYIATVMDALVNLIQKDDFLLTELVISENKLKNDLHNFINALGSNQSLQVLDITGNYMGDIGARLLAKALQINNKLKTILLDRNNITLQGYSDIVYALENNYSMKHIPFPLFDIAPCLKAHPERTDFVMRKMQESLHRNTSGLRRTNGYGFRLQHGFLLSSTHQLIDKLVSETQETMSMRCNSFESSVQRLLDDAENCKQLLPKLQESIRCEPHPIEVRLNKMTNELSLVVKTYLLETMETMLRTGVEQCPKTLGNQSVINELRKSCEERLTIPDDFLQACVFNSAGSEIINKISEVEQSLAGLISDRATDEVLEALTRYKRGLGITDSPNSLADDSLAPDIVRSRSSQDSIGFQFDTRGLDLPRLGLDSPTATPQLQTKRRSVARKVRPQSVVGLGIENLSLGHIPDLLGSPTGSQYSRASKGSFDEKQDECCDSITELPSQSLTLQHLVKTRPRRAKTRAPTRLLLTEIATQNLSDGIESFFRPGSATPSTLTPLVSPTSEECSSLSFVDSPTMSRDDGGMGGKYSNVTSEETTPILEERKPIKLERQSPLNKNSNCSATRSVSSDNLEKCSPQIGRKSPLIKMNTELSYSKDEGKTNDHHLQQHTVANNSDDKHKSPSNDSIKSQILKTPITAPKPRPWSVLGHESKNDFNVNDSTKTTPDSIDNDVDVVLISSQTPGGSIVGISGGGSIVGITPGAALEKKSVRDMAAGINKLGENNLNDKKPVPAPRNFSVTTQRNQINSLNENILSQGSDNNDSVGKIVAGKKITALFEETLVEGLHKSSLRHTIYKESNYNTKDSVDV